jgi:hypothetical protein
MLKRYILGILLSLLFFNNINAGGIGDWWDRGICDCIGDWWDKGETSNKIELITAFLRAPVSIAQNSLKRDSSYTKELFYRALVITFFAYLLRVVNNLSALCSKPDLLLNRYRFTEMIYDTVDLASKIQYFMSSKNLSEEQDSEEKDSLNKFIKILHKFILPVFESYCAVMGALNISMVEERKQVRVVIESLGLLSRVLSDIIVLKKGTLEFKAKVIILVLLICASVYEIYDYYTGGKGSDLLKATVKGLFKGVGKGFGEAMAKEAFRRFVL